MGQGQTVKIQAKSTATSKQIADFRKRLQESIATYASYVKRVKEAGDDVKDYEDFLTEKQASLESLKKEAGNLFVESSSLTSLIDAQIEDIQNRISCIRELEGDSVYVQERRKKANTVTGLLRYANIGLLEKVFVYVETAPKTNHWRAYPLSVKFLAQHNPDKPESDHNIAFSPQGDAKTAEIRAHYGAACDEQLRKFFNIPVVKELNEMLSGPLIEVDFADFQDPNEYSKIVSLFPGKKTWHEHILCLTLQQGIEENSAYLSLPYCKYLYEKACKKIYNFPYDKKIRIAFEALPQKWQKLVYNAKTNQFRIPSVWSWNPIKIWRIFSLKRSRCYFNLLEAIREGEAPFDEKVTASTPESRIRGWIDDLNEKGNREVADLKTAEEQKEEAVTQCTEEIMTQWQNTYLYSSLLKKTPEKNPREWDSTLTALDTLAQQKAEAEAEKEKLWQALAAFSLFCAEQGLLPKKGVNKVVSGVPSRQSLFKGASGEAPSVPPLNQLPAPPLAPGVK